MSKFKSVLSKELKRQILDENRLPYDPQIVAAMNAVEQSVLANLAEPLVFENWDLLRPEIKYIAKDSDETWVGHTKEPTIEEGSQQWVSSDSYVDFFFLGGLDQGLLPRCEWRNSLLKRPEND